MTGPFDPNDAYLDALDGFIQARRWLLAASPDEIERMSESLLALGQLLAFEAYTQSVQRPDRIHRVMFSTGLGMIPSLSWQPAVPDSGGTDANRS